MEFATALAFDAGTLTTAAFWPHLLQIGKVAPLGGSQTTVTLTSLSVALAVYVTTAPPGPLAGMTMLAGSVRTGLSASVTVTVNESVAVRPLVSST